MSAVAPSCRNFSTSEAMRPIFSPQLLPGLTLKARQRAADFEYARKGNNLISKERTVFGSF